VLDFTPVPYKFLTGHSDKSPKVSLTWLAIHNVVSREINPWKGFDLLMRSNLYSLAVREIHPLEQSATCLIMVILIELVDTQSSIVHGIVY